MAHDRFVNSALSELQEANRSPIDGYQYLPVLRLEEAIGKITQPISDIMDQVATAKTKCNRQSTLLTHDESAAIYLYTMPITFFSRLNEALRAEDRHALEPWFAFLKLLMTALEKLPSHKGIVWRGVCENVSSVFANGDVHPLWSVNSFSMDLKLVEFYLGETGTVFIIETIHGKDISAFSAFPVEQEVVLMPGTYVSAKSLPLDHNNRLFIVHLKEENSRSYVLELIKHRYQQHSRIERIMNPSKSFPIEESYINLAIVETKEQQEKEKKLLNTNHTNEIIGTYEEIYGTKTKIEIQNIFEKCKDQTKNILVLGRAGIGKTTFCRYVAYQWATGVIWQQYELVILISLRNLAENRYPRLTSGANYSLNDLVKTEYFYDGLSDEYERLLKEELSKSQVLWLLDGYDEIIQNIPKHLQYLLDQLLNKPHHILTSRPYLNTLSYNVQLEITGFTDDNIKQYVTQFFEQIKDKMHDASDQAQKLLNFLKFNPRIWGIVHIPVNLELICSVWCNTEWAETATMTMTSVYDQMIEWLCRRYLTKQNVTTSSMRKNAVFNRCNKELAFLETLAFIGMQEKTVMLRPKLLVEAERQTELSLDNYPHFLNLGILKSFDDRPIGTCTEAGKNHYFVHLSFQEHFAARYLVKALSGNKDQKKKATDFIETNKYNRRLELVITFTSGLLIDSGKEDCISLFWDTLLEKSLDLIGLRHVQIVISCMEEAGCSTRIPHYPESIDLIIKWIKYIVFEKDIESNHPLLISLRRSPLLVNQKEIHDTFIELCQHKDPSINKKTSSFISDLPISDVYLDLIRSYLTALNDKNMQVGWSTFEAVYKMGLKVGTNEVINKLIDLLGDTSGSRQSSASEALGMMHEKAGTKEVINKLVILLGDTDARVKTSACEVLGRMGEKAATTEVINKLLILLGDTNDGVKTSACKVLGRMGAKAAITEVINKLIDLLGDTDNGVKTSACEVLKKMGGKAATKAVISGLLILVADMDRNVRRRVCDALYEMGGNAETNQVINRLLILLSDMDGRGRRTTYEAIDNMDEQAVTDKMTNRLLILLGDVDDHTRSHAIKALSRTLAYEATNKGIQKLIFLFNDMHHGVTRSAYEAVCTMSENATTNKVINELIILLDDTDDDVRSNVCKILGRMGEKAATNEVINKLQILLSDTHDGVKRSACEAVGKMGGKAATTEVINELIFLLGDRNDDIKYTVYIALDKMGEKAETNEVINKLVILLGDTDACVKISACEVLGRMGAKAATTEVINKLIDLLGDTDNGVKRSASDVLGRMGAKSATTEVINKLVILLGDTDARVKTSACEVLGRMGAKAATTEVINKLIDLLGDTDNGIKRSASDVLKDIGGKAATNEGINKLIDLLSDMDDSVKTSACEVLKKMGEKAATTEVINKLIDLLGDTDNGFKRSACDVLKKMGEKAATNEVINKLIDLLSDTDDGVKRNVCEVLGEMGEKAQTTEVVKKLILVLGDRCWWVKCSACKVLGKMGAKAATTEVINKLIFLLGDMDDSVKKSACEALGKIGEEAATTEVINKLIFLLSDTNVEVKRNACEALGKMGEKVATHVLINGMITVVGSSERVWGSDWNRSWASDSNKRWAIDALCALGKTTATDEVIGMLLDACVRYDSVRSDAPKLIQNILNALSSVSNLKEETVRKLSEYADQFSLWEYTKISPEKFIEAFLKTEILFWCPIIRMVFNIHEYGFTVAGNKVMVFGSQEPVELSFSNEELGKKLRVYLIDWRDKPLQSIVTSELTSKHLNNINPRKRTISMSSATTVSSEESTCAVPKQLRLDQA